MLTFYAAVFLSNFNEFSLTEILGYVDELRKNIIGLLNFFPSLPEVIFVLFPFLSVSQAEYIGYLLYVSLAVVAFFFIKKVFS